MTLTRRQRCRERGTRFAGGFECVGKWEGCTGLGCDEKIIMSLSYHGYQRGDPRTPPKRETVDERGEILHEMVSQVSIWLYNRFYSTDCYAYSTPVLLPYLPRFVHNTLKFHSYSNFRRSLLQILRSFRRDWQYIKRKKDNFLSS